MNGTNSTRVADFKVEDWLPPWLPPDALIGALAALAVLVAFLAVWQALRVYDPFERRFAQIAQRKQSLKQAALETRRRRRTVDSAGFMNKAVARLNLLRSKHAGEARRLLAQAGLRSQEAMVRYLFARIMLPFAFAATVLLDSFGAHLLPIPPNFTTIAAMFAAIAGFYGPGMFVRNKSNKRGQRLQLGLPDALDLMVICAEAGLSLDAALVRVSRELEPTWPELSEELGITAAELTFLPDRRQALENLNLRTNLASVRGVVNTLLQTARFGTPLAQSLRVLAAEFREARLTRAEEKAARLPAMLTVPMIVFILPTLFIVVLGPAALGIIDTFSGKKAQEGDKTVTAHNSSGEGGGPGTATVVGDQPDSSETGAGSGHTTIVMRNDPAGQKAVVGVTIAPTKETMRIIDPIVVDIDARALSSGFQHRLAVVPAGAPDKVEDAAAFARDSAPVQPSRMRVFLSARSAGEDEIRLYYIPQFGSEFVAAGRAKITVKPGAPGATEASQLIAEAGVLGAAAFENSYRGRSLTIEGQLLRVESHTAEELDWAAKLTRSLDPGKSYAAMFIGWTETAPRIDGSPSELVCVLPSDDPILQGRAGSLKPGEPILVRGMPAGVRSVSGGTAVVVANCQLVP
jgi:tight adherence protein C